MYTHEYTRERVPSSVFSVYEVSLSFAAAIGSPRVQERSTSICESRGDAFGRDRVPSYAYGACARIPLISVVSFRPIRRWYVSLSWQWRYSLSDQGVLLLVLSLVFIFVTPLVHSLSFSPTPISLVRTRQPNANYFSLSFSLTHTPLTLRHLYLVNRALAVLSVLIPAALSVPLNLSPALALARLHLSPQALSLSHSLTHQFTDFSFSHRYSFTTTQKWGVWGLNHTEVGGDVVGEAERRSSRGKRARR